MDQFEFMVSELQKDRFQEILMSDSEKENVSLAMVESTLLYGYKISDVAEYKKVSVMKRV